jgi:hypothetical protein
MAATMIAAPLLLLAQLGWLAHPAAAAAALRFGVDEGVLDVTAPPFSVDNSGRTDTTAALQAAVAFAHNRTLVAYLPAGDYVISDTIKCYETFDWHTEDNNTWPSRFTPHVLVGQHAGAGQRRPRLVLAEASPGFGDTAKLKNVVHFTAISYDPNNAQASIGQEQNNVNFNQLFRGIDIEIRKGNTGAVGIFHQAAQGSSVQDCTIFLGDGHTGLAGAAGSGGSHAGVTVIGGQIGLDLSNAQPAPTVTGMTLINQTLHAIVYNFGREALSSVGVRIVMSAEAQVAVAAGGGDSWWHSLNEMAFIDTTIDCSAAAAAASPGGATAFNTTASLYLQNVFLLGCQMAVISPALQYAAPKPPIGGEWVVIDDLVAGVDIAPSANTACDKWSMDVWIDGVRQASKYLVNASLSSRYENGLLEPFMHLKMIILPRQARDKHRGNSKTDRFLHSIPADAVPDVVADHLWVRRAISVLI